MSFTAFYRRASQILKNRFPSSQELGEGLDLEYLLSPHKLQLPRSVAQQAAEAIQVHYELARSPRLEKQILLEQPWLKDVPQRRDSILMAYDFHTTDEGEAFLVEVNTNASMYLMSLLLYEAHGHPAEWKGQSSDQALWRAFEQEWQALGRSDQPSLVTIVDDQIEQQKMFIEFLMYRDWFQAHGWAASLNEGHDFTFAQDTLKDRSGRQVDLVYNRLTDFALADARLLPLRQAYLQNAAVITPHPWAYSLLADKERLAEWTEPGRLESFGANEQQCLALRKVLIPTYSLAQLGSSEEIWAKRKNLFFKPSRSHGGKSVYRGASVSRKVFERLMEEDTIAQQFVPAQSWPLHKDDTYLENWKFDVRFFVYRDQIQLAVARAYQGQVTNFSSRFGGLTAIDFI